MQKSITNTLLVLSWLCKKILVGLIYGIRPFLGPSNCSYYVSCSDYGLQQITTQPLHKAVWNIIKRLINCANPWCEHIDVC
jgi:putative component of membrane protein insertase Oxa1/YidC/SpoIIIJ protein YidD